MCGSKGSAPDPWLRHGAPDRGLNVRQVSSPELSDADLHLWPASDQSPRDPAFSNSSLSDSSPESAGR